MFIPRALSSAAETSIATSSHSLNSSPPSVFTRSSEPSGSKTASSVLTTSIPHSTTSSDSAVSTFVASPDKFESGFEANPSSSQVASSTAVTSHTSESLSSSSSSKPSDSTILTMTSKSVAQLSTTIKEPPRSGASPTTLKSGASSASTASVLAFKQSVSLPSSAGSSTHLRANKSSSHPSAAHAASAAASKANISPTSTSTITDQPLSTFSTPVAVTLTNSLNGQKATTAPPLITSIGTSMDSNGSTIAYTHVIANPTGSFSNNSGVSQSSFLRKPGQVIATFLAVGVVLAALIGYVICLLHRRQRRRRSEHTRASVKGSPVDDHSFLDLSEVPQMRTIPIDVRKKPSVVWGPRPRHPEESSLAGPSQPVSAYMPNEPRGVGPAGTKAVGISMDKEVGPFSDLYAAPERGESATGLAVTTGQEMVHMRTPSYAPSSPSLYSVSMKTASDDADSLYEREMGIETPRISESLSPSASKSSGSMSMSPNTQLLVAPRSVMEEGRKIP